MTGFLIEAATLAESLSASRRLRIDLKITSKGVMIEGAYFGADLELHATSDFLVSWEDLTMAAQNPLTEAIRLVDRNLRELWKVESE